MGECLRNCKSSTSKGSQEWRERQAKDVTGNPAHIFTTLEGKAVSPRYVQKMVARLAATAGIQKNVHPHTLRHLFDTDLYRETSKSACIQRCSGI